MSDPEPRWGPSIRRSVRDKLFFLSLNPFISLCYSQPLKSSGKGCGNFMRLLRCQNSINLIIFSWKPFSWLINHSLTETTGYRHTNLLFKSFYICLLRIFNSVCLILVTFCNIKGAVGAWFIMRNYPNIDKSVLCS